MIIEKGKIKDSVFRLDALKRKAILKHCEEVDFDSKFSLYDYIFKDLEEEFEEFFLKDISDEKKQDIMNSVSDYLKFCFYEEEKDNWLDSVEDKIGDDYELIVLRILDNCDFLVRVFKEGGAEALSVLKMLSDNDFYNESSIVDRIRNTFFADEILIAILKSMGEENSIYNIFTDEQKLKLFDFPEGTLYFFDSDFNVHLSNPIVLADEINNRCNDFASYRIEDDNDILALEIADIMGDIRNSDFEDVVLHMSNDYMSSLGKIKDMTKVVVKSDEPKKYWWDIDKTSLGEFVDTPYNSNRRR